MSKLLKLKQWLTLPDAARHLSIMFGEEVSEADVLQLGIDGHLRLSVNLVNHATARRAHVVPLNEAKMYVFAANPSALPAIVAKGVRFGEVATLSDEIQQGLKDGSFTLTPMGDVLDPSRVIECESAVTTLVGVWDLPMIAGEALDVSHALHWRIGGPEVTLTCLDGAFAGSLDGELYQLLESFDDNEYQPGSRAQLERLKERIVEEGIGAPTAAELLEKHKEDRRKFLKERDSKPREEGYYPAGGIPHDSLLVVRTAALHELQDRMSESKTAAKPLGERERTTLLTIIAALAKEARIDVSKPSKAGGMMESLTEQMGARVSARTIEEHLKKIPGALESRASSTP
jgi:hypothetical protein